MMYAKNSLFSSIAILVPVYNEYDNLKVFIPELMDVMRSLCMPFTIYVIDDGSSDGSGECCELFPEYGNSVRCVSLGRRFGKSYALSIGIQESSEDVIVTLDGDCQDDPKDIPKLLDALRGGADLVCSWRQHRKDAWIKVLLSGIFNVVTRVMTGVKVHDFNGGMKAYRRHIFSMVAIYGELHRFIPALVAAHGFRVTETQTVNRKRNSGVSKFGVQRYIAALFDLLTVVFLTRFLRKPAHFFGGIALMFMSVGTSICLYISHLRFIFGNIQNRYPLLFLGVLLIIVGVQFLSVGLLGEMMVYDRYGRERSRSRGRKG